MLTECVTDGLKASGVSLDEFSELCLRLLNYGVLCRSESLTEQQLYDRYVRIAEIVDEYLALVGVRVLHDRRFEFVRLYPPGSHVPGMEDAEDGAFGGGLRARLRQDEVALLLVLRLQYDKALREGNVDENGFVAESMESLGIAMKNLLGRGLPDKLTERKRILQRLRQLRLIEYRQDDEMENEEAWLRIHPMIASFVSESALATLEQGLPATEGEEADDVP